MLQIVLGLHAYQPPTQDRRVLHKISQESYDRVFNVINTELRNSDNVICVDLAYSLYEQLIKDRPSTWGKFFDLATGGSIHPVSTLAYHPIAPMVRPEVWIEQLILNDSVTSLYRPKGIFFPEMALDKETIRLIPPKWKWTVTSDAFTIKAPHKYIPTVHGFPVFLMPHNVHHKICTERISPKETLDHLFKWYNDGYVVLWMDFETFGHHNDNIETFFRKFLELINHRDDVALTTPDELLNKYPLKEIEFNKSSWAPKDPNPFFVWDGNGKDEWINNWWAKAKRIQEICPLNDIDVHKALYSCQPWMWTHGEKGLANAGAKLFDDLYKKYNL